MDCVLYCLFALKIKNGKEETYEEKDDLGYVSKVSVESYEQGFHNRFALEAEELQKLAGDDGIISNIYVLYHGNTDKLLFGIIS